MGGNVALRTSPEVLLALQHGRVHASVTTPSMVTHVLHKYPRASWWEEMIKN